MLLLRNLNIIWHSVPDWLSMQISCLGFGYLNVTLLNDLLHATSLSCHFLDNTINCINWIYSPKEKQGNTMYWFKNSYISTLPLSPPQSSRVIGRGSDLTVCVLDPRLTSCGVFLGKTLKLSQCVSPPRSLNGNWLFVRAPGGNMIKQHPNSGEQQYL